MKFDKGIAKKYRKSIDEAVETILEKGNENHQSVMRAMIDSEMMVCVAPFSEVNASGIAGVIEPGATNERILSDRLSLNEAFKEVFITFAKETLNSQRGCEGTLVHEGRHAYDFARAISSFSDTDINPLSIFNPTRYELEWEAHLAAGEYVLRIGKEDYIQEGLDIMILEEKDGQYFISEEGIKRRLLQSYNMSEDGNQGEQLTEMFSLVVK